MGYRSSAAGLWRAARRPALAAACCAAGMLLAAGQPRAQEAPRPPEPNRAAYRQVARSCEPEVRRFCPELAASSSQPRNWAICLKPFRASLSFGCRRAVRAVFPQG